MIDHCISSPIATFEMSRGRRSWNMTVFVLFDHNNFFQVSVCRPLIGPTVTLREENYINCRNARSVGDPVKTLPKCNISGDALVGKAKESVTNLMSLVYLFLIGCTWYIVVILIEAPETINCYLDYVVLSWEQYSFVLIVLADEMDQIVWLT